jgi:hypothetical protein
VRFSSDGQRIAYASDESGQMQVYVRDFPGPGGAVQISTDGGTQPVWSGDGSRLYYRNGNAVLEATLAPGRSVVVRSRTVVAADGPESGISPSRAATSRVSLCAGRSGPAVVHDWWANCIAADIQRTK